MVQMAGFSIHSPDLGARLPPIDAPASRDGDPQHRAAKRWLETELCHSFRTTGITVYLTNGSLLEHAQRMAAHESARGTTKLYGRRNDKVTLDEVERIVL